MASSIVQFANYSVTYRLLVVLLAAIATSIHTNFGANDHMLQTTRSYLIY